MWTKVVYNLPNKLFILVFLCVPNLYKFVYCHNFLPFYTQFLFCIQQPTPRLKQIIAGLTWAATLTSLSTPLVYALEQVVFPLWLLTQLANVKSVPLSLSQPHHIRQQVYVDATPTTIAAVWPDRIEKLYSILLRNTLSSLWRF